MSKSNYHYTHREANFGQPLKTEVPGGSHLTLEIVPRVGDSLIALRHTQPFHGGPANGLYFVHGLIRFGEQLDQAVSRLLQEQVGLKLHTTCLYSLDSWVDDNAHWHIVLNIVATSQGVPQILHDISEIVTISPKSPAPTLEWWSPEDIANLFSWLRRR